MEVRTTAWETPFSVGQPVIVERVPYNTAVDPVGGRATQMAASCVCSVPNNGLHGTKDHVPVRMFAPGLLIGKGEREAGGDLIGFIWKRTMLTEEG